MPSAERTSEFSPALIVLGRSRIPNRVRKADGRKSAKEAGCKVLSRPLKRT
jgi:hypothetical protein